MFSPEEFPYYNSKSDFDWEQIINLMYHRQSKELAKKLLKQQKLNNSTLI
jgi:hypothetical protein